MVDSIINKMTLEEKVGQMLCLAFHGTEYNEQLKFLLEDNNIGTIIHFARNVKDTKQIFELNKEMIKHSKYPLFIGVDQEGGMVRRVQEGITYLPGAMALTNQEEDKIYEIYKKVAAELKLLGFNMDYTPCLDINNNPLNPVINSRSYSDSKEEVTRLGLIASLAFQSSLVMPTPKHFPGHGNTSVDSHLGLPVVSDDLFKLQNNELVPFKKAIDEGIDGMMISHILYDKIDELYPSSISKKVITDLLINTMGYKGLIITDSLTMAAIWGKYSVREIIEKGINAGNDIIMFCGEASIPMQKEIIDTFIDLVKTNVISLDRVNKSVKKILTLKEKYCVSDISYSFEDIKEELNSKSELSSQLTMNSITLVKGNMDNINTTKVLSIFPKINLASLVDNTNNNYESLGYYLGCDEEIYDDDIKTFEKIVQKSQKYDKIILATYNIKKGDYQTKLFDLLDKTKTVVVALRSPYDILCLNDVRTYICTYDCTKESVKALTNAIKNNQFCGKLPIKLI